MPSTALLAPHADAIAALCRRYGVARLELFGSAATGQFRPGQSDYDFLMELDLQAEGSLALRLVDFAEALETLLGAPVDLVNPNSIRNRYFAAEVERTRVPVYG
jgi:predicted nucleotidyltransferase